MERARVVPSTSDRGGFDILHRGCVFWARTLPLALAAAEAAEMVVGGPPGLRVGPTSQGRGLPFRGARCEVIKVLVRGL